MSRAITRAHGRAQQPATINAAFAPSIISYSNTGRGTQDDESSTTPSNAGHHDGSSQAAVANNSNNIVMVLLHHPPPLLPIIVLIVYQAIDSSDSDKTLMQPVCVGKLDQYQHLMDTSVTIYVFFSTSTKINQNYWLKSFVVNLMMPTPNRLL